MMHSEQPLVSKVHEAEQATSPEPNPMSLQYGPTLMVPSQASVNEYRGQRLAGAVRIQVSSAPLPQAGPLAGQSDTPGNV